MIQAKPLDPSAESLPVGGDLNREAAIDATTEKGKGIDVDQQAPAVDNALTEPRDDNQNGSLFGQNDIKGYGSAPVQKSSEENGPAGKTTPAADTESLTLEQSKPINDERSPANGIADKPTIGGNDAEVFYTGFDPTSPNTEEVESIAPKPDDEKIYGIQPDGSESNLQGLPSPMSDANFNNPSLGPVPPPGNELGAPPGGPQEFQNLPTGQPATSSWYGNGQINSNVWNVKQNRGGQFGRNWNTRPLRPWQGPSYRSVPHMSAAPPQVVSPPSYRTGPFNDVRGNSMHTGFIQVKFPAYGPFYWYPIVNEGTVIRWVLAPASYASVLGHLPHERAISPLEAMSNSDDSAFTISRITSGFHQF